jgi:signal transduction histidine kinase
VRDFGIGIAPEERKAVFDRYHRSPGTAGMGPGSGIGLAILRRFSEEYGLGIELESELGKGSTFRLRFRDPNPCR